MNKLGFVSKDELNLFALASALGSIGNVKPASENTFGVFATIANKDSYVWVKDDGSVSANVSSSVVFTNGMIVRGFKTAWSEKKKQFYTFAPSIGGMDYWLKQILKKFVSGDPEEVHEVVTRAYNAINGELFTSSGREKDLPLAIGMVGADGVRDRAMSDYLINAVNEHASERLTSQIEYRKASKVRKAAAKA